MKRLSVAAAIATRNRPVSLARLMVSLLAQDRRPEQILIVDDGELASDWLAEWGGRCRQAQVQFVYHRKDRPGRSASRNLAADLATADVVCFLDDDCEPAADFLEKLLSALEVRESLVAVDGRVLPAAGATLGFRLYRWMLRAAGWWALAPASGPKEIAPGLAARATLCGVAAVRRTALQGVRFDESLSHGEDFEWSVRLARVGRIGRVDGAVCHHHLDPSGRPRPFAIGVRMARSYLYSQGKLFGRAGRSRAAVTLLMLALGETAFGVAMCLALGRGGPGRMVRAAGLIAGLFSPGGPRAD